MDLCGGLIVFGGVLFLVAGVGHALWLLFSAMLRFVLQTASPPPGRPRDADEHVVCLACGVRFRQPAGRCPLCGVAYDTAVARELHELEAAVRCLQGLIDRNAIGAAESEAVYGGLEARQAELLQKLQRGPARAPVPEVLPARPLDGPVAVAPAAPAPAVEAPAVPPEPRRSWGQMLAGFMEERNILWGELVGGLLIVGCSIALVISLWRTLEEQIHYFPFLVVAGLTCTLFAAGQYSLRHWKLEATSRGLLVIATLLTPLCFLVLAGLAQGREAGFVDWATELFSLVGFGALVTAAALPTVAPLRPAAPWAKRAVSAAVMFSSASQLLVPRWLEVAEPHPVVFVVLSVAPVVVQALAVGLLLVAVGRRGGIGPAEANALLLALAQTAFAAAVALAFIVYWSETPAQTLRLLAVPVALLGLPFLAVGARVYSQRNAEPVTEAKNGPQAVSRLVGTGVGVAGVVLIVAALGLGWPRPAALILIGLCNAAVFAALGLAIALPQAQIPAAACFSLGFMTLVHWLRNALVAETTGTQLLTLMLSPSGAPAWAASAALLALAAEGFASIRRRADAAYLAGTAGVVAVVGMACVMSGGLAPTLRGASVFAAAGVGTLLSNIRWRRGWITAAGAVALTGGLLYFTTWATPDRPLSQSLVFSLLCHATLMLSLGLLLQREAAFGRPLCDVVVAVTALTALMIALCADWNALEFSAIAASWLALLWCILAADRHEAGFLNAAQAATVAAGALGVGAWLHGRPWVGGEPVALWHLWSLQAQVAGLASVALAWAVARLAARRVAWLHVLFARTAIDHWLATGLVAAQLILAAIALWPELRREIAPDVNLELMPWQVPKLRLSWAFASVLLLGLALASQRGRLAGWAILDLGVTLPLLIALCFRDEQAVASAARWVIAIGYLVNSAAVWTRKLFDAEDGRQDRIDSAHAVLVSCSLVPVFAITAWTAGRLLNGLAVPGPDAGTLFARIGWTASLTIPLLLLVPGMVGHALRENWAEYAFAAGLVVAAAVAGGYAVAVRTSGRAFAAAECLHFGQLGVMTLGGWGLAWLVSGRWRTRGYLFAQTGLASAILLAISATALSALLLRLGGPLPAWLGYVGGILAWSGWVAAGVAAVWVMDLFLPMVVVHVAAIFGLCAGVLTACAVAPMDASGWSSYHVLTLALALAGFLLVALAWIGETAQALGPGYWRRERRAAAAEAVRCAFPTFAVRRWVEVVCAVVVGLAVAGIWPDPGRPYWSVLAALAVSVLLGAMAVWSGRTGYTYASGLMLNLAAYLLFLSWYVDAGGSRRWLPVGPGVADRLLLMQVAALAGGSVAWSLLDLVGRRRFTREGTFPGALPYSTMAAWLALHVLAALVLVALAGDLLRLELRLAGWMPWAALGMTVAAIALLNRDTDGATDGLPNGLMYVVGLVAVGLALHQCELAPRRLAWAATVSLAGYVAAAAVVTRLFPIQRAELRTAQRTAGVCALALGFWISIGFATLAARLGGPFAAVLLILAGVVSRCSLELILWISAAAATQFTWALLDPSGTAPGLHRSARLLAVLASFACVTAWAALRRVPAARSGAVRFGAAAAVVLAAVLLQEFRLYDPETRHTPLGIPEMLLVAGLLAAAAAAAVWAAVSRHPALANWSPRRRSAAVWGAELLVLLLLTHLRLNVPDFFPAFFGRHWHYTVMGVGLVAVSLAELFRRRGVDVLAGPLHQTGMVLPLLPLAAFLIRPVLDLRGLREVVPGAQPLLRYLDRLPHDFELHAKLWFLLATLYALIGVLRRSANYGVVSAVASTFGLWVIFANNPSLAFALHPQLWLIPTGLIVLAAEAINRDRLSHDQSAAVRYAGLLLIYVASAADMFITGLGHSVLLPIVLAVLSVAGILAGILLRVRGFLYLGVAFLLLVVLSQIWHAAVDRRQTWVWWASGIALGVAILALFAVFEKRRDDVRRVVAGMREWRT